MCNVFTKGVVLLGLAWLVTGCGTMSVPFLGQPTQATDNTNTQTADARADDEQKASRPAVELVSANPAVLTPVPKLKSGNQALFDRAVELMSQGKSDAAEVLLSELTESQPELAGPWINLGLIRASQDDAAGAESAFNEAVSANPNNCDARNQLGILLRRRGAFSAAEQQYQECLKVDPTRADVQLNLGILYELYMGRLADALVAYGEYQMLVAEPDQQVAGWVADLERRVAQIAKR